MSEISVQDIELLNAHGPYNHAVWIGQGRKLTHEEALEGRGEYLARTLRQVLCSRYSSDEMRSMTILDVGCYDGWLLHQISDLPFARIVGIEPREKNIRKGQVARRILGIDSRVEFLHGGLDSLPSTPYDIVVATGLLHHVESPAQALRGLRTITKKLLFIETIVLDSRHISPSMKAEIEPKDVVYFGKAPICGLSGQKLESAYYDGSSTGLQVVSIPTWETLTLACEAAGFSSPKPEADPSDFRRAAWRDRRECNAAIFTAEPVALSPLGQGQEYERRFAECILNLHDLKALDLDQTNGLPEAIASLAERQTEDTARDIVQAFRHAPADKIRVEQGKSLLAAKRLEKAEAVFTTVTRRWNADWRSVYRSFHYLRAIARLRGDAAAESHYAELLTISNPHFPEDAWPLGETNHV